MYVMVFSCLILYQAGYFGFASILIGITALIGGTLGIKTKSLAFLPMKNGIGRTYNNSYGDYDFNHVFGFTMNCITIFGGIVFILIGLSDL